jgi:hypothetical protein
LPSITITDPAPNSVVPSVVEVQALAFSYYGIVRTSLFADGSLVAYAYVSQDSGFSFIWNATNERSGTQHRLQASVIDSAGNVGWSNVEKVTISNTTGPTVHTGKIRSDETWLAAASPHIVKETVDVGAVLTIEAGAVVRFDSGAVLEIGQTQAGALVAQGGASLITFTSNASSPGPGDWGGIIFGPLTTEGLTAMDNCLIEYGGSDLACIVTDSARIKMTNCVVRQSAEFGVACGAGGFLAFSGNALVENQMSGLAIDPRYVMTIGAGNQFSDNGSDGIAIRPSVVTGDVFWPNLGIPYYVDTVLVVGSTIPARLTLDPGVTILFGAFGGIDVAPLGRLIADGSGGLITFTGVLSSVPSYWTGGIQIDAGPDALPSVFRNCLVERVDAEAGIIIDSSQAEISNSTIQDCSGYGVLTRDGGQFSAFTGNTITGCQEWALSVEAGCIASIGAGNRLTGNDLQDDEDAYDVIDVTGDNGVSESGTWPNCGVPYQFLDDVVIENENVPPVIVIAPGTVIELNGGSIYVGQDAPGGLVADGTAGRITFTRPEPYGAQTGAWNSIVFGPIGDSGQMVLRHCLVEGGGASQGNIVCDHCSPIIDSCEICYSANYGVMLVGSALIPDTLRFHNKFHDNALGDIGTAASFIKVPRLSSPRRLTAHSSRPSAVSRRSFAGKEER